MFTNRPLIMALGVTVLLQLAVLYVPVLQAFFSTTPLTPGQLALSVALAAAVFAAVELSKLASRMAGRARPEPPPTT